MFFSTVLFELLFLVLSPLPPAAPAPQAQGEKASKIQDDLDFAVDMARYRYFDLANDYVEKIKGEKLTDSEKDTLVLTNAAILKLASENAVDPTERLDFYRRAVAEFKGFVEYSTHHPKYDQARIDLGEVYTNLARFLSESLDSAENAEAREALKKECEESFRNGIQLFNDAGASLRQQAEALEEEGNVELAQKQFTQARKTDYKKGVAYYYWGLIYSVGEFNREDYLNRAVNTLDDYIWDSPEDDFYVLWAYVYQSMAYTELGNLSDALDLAAQVYDPTTGVDLNQATQLAPEYAKLITDLTETAYLQVTKIYLRKGEIEKADETVQDMIEKFKSRNLELSPIGDQARLEQAKGLLELGDPEQSNRAAQICKEVGDRNPNNNVGRDAKVILKNIIEGGETSTAEVNLSPDVLFSAAEGSRIERNFAQAIMAYMKVFQACKTKQLKEEFIGKTWYAIGQCYSQMGDHLEAALAFEQGFTDPDIGSDKSNFESNAMNWYSSLSRRHKETRTSFDEELKKEARNKLVQLNVSTDLRFMIANDKFNKALTLTGKEKEEAMKEALDEFDQMDKQSKLFERSMVYKARCYLEMGKYEEALKEFDAFKSYVEKATIPGTVQQKTYRSSALAEEAYWRAETCIKMERFEDALAALDEFEDRFKVQQDFFPAVVYNRMISMLGLEKFNEAENLYKDLEKNYPDSARAATAAYYMATSYYKKCEAVRGPEGSTPPKEYMVFLKKAAEYMKLYCERSGYDSFTNLKAVCEWYAQLGDLGESGATEEARDDYKKLLKEFGKDPAYTEEIENTVYRGYGEVLLKLHDFNTAKPIWLKLLINNSKSLSVLRSTAFCMGGWLEYEGPDFVEIPGSGDYAPDPAEKRDGNKVYLDTALGIWQYLLKGIDQAGNKYNPDWWEAKFYTIYCRYRGGEKYPELYDRALAVIKNQKLFTQDMGGPEWRPKFNFIEKAIKEKNK